MPTLQVLAVRDRALDAFGTPIFVPAISVAVRSFSDEVNRPDSALCAHPEDYDLFHLGSFEDSTGRLLSLELPRQVAIGKDLKRSAD